MLVAWPPSSRGCAEAAWLGTRFLLAQEMPIHEEYRQRVLDVAETDTRWVRQPLRGRVAGRAQPVSPELDGQAWRPLGRPPPGSRPGEGDVIADFASGEQILRYEPAAPMVGTTGDIEAISLWAGQSVALARQLQSAAEIVAELVSGL